MKTLGIWSIVIGSLLAIGATINCFPGDMESFLEKSADRLEVNSRLVGAQASGEAEVRGKVEEQRKGRHERRLWFVIPAGVLLFGGLIILAAASQQNNEAKPVRERSISGNPETAESRLEKLLDLKQKNLITEIEFESKRADILKDI